MAGSNVIVVAAEHLSQGTEGSAEFVTQVSGWSQTVDAASLTGLLPLAITMLILHEMYFATSENRAPRIGWMLLRIVGFGACLAGYDRIVGLLTGLVGGSSAWPETSDLIAPLEYGLRANLRMLGLMSLGNLGETLGPFLVWAMLFMVDCLLALFAVIVVTVLVKIQALLLIIFIASGKTCLILSIMPGVGIGKSWAKAVATVAAWGAMGGVVFAAVGFSAQRFAHFSSSSNIQAHFQIWLAYAVLGIFFMAIPKLVGALVSGSMSAAPGLGAAVAGGFMAAKFVSPSLRGRNSVAAKSGQPGGGHDGGGQGGGGRRGGKVDRGSAPQSGVPGAARGGEASARAGASGGQRRHQAKSARAIEKSDNAGANGGYQKIDQRPANAEYRHEEGAPGRSPAVAASGGRAEGTASRSPRAEGESAGDASPRHGRATDGAAAPSGQAEGAGAPSPARPAAAAEGPGRSATGRADPKQNGPSRDAAPTVHGSMRAGGAAAKSSVEPIASSPPAASHPPNAQKARAEPEMAQRSHANASEDQVTSKPTRRRGSKQERM